MKIEGRDRRHKRIRKKMDGTVKKPRLCVFRSLKNLSAQLIDDVHGKTLFAMSTSSVDVKTKEKNGGNIKAALLLGETFAKKAVEKGFTEIIFDRAGYKYHGRVKALADACRKNGLKF
ncbi:MAG: 50S ribosomal protein L18 [Candidatus Omnitrophica bacterium]|nr:50S ribosomal protein L18 [Candidatus Omnitrophota bacterium]